MGLVMAELFLVLFVCGCGEKEKSHQERKGTLPASISGGRHGQASQTRTLRLVAEPQALASSPLSHKGLTWCLTLTPSAFLLSKLLAAALGRKEG